jgi:hypothetical protein
LVFKFLIKLGFLVRGSREKCLLFFPLTLPLRGSLPLPGGERVGVRGFVTKIGFFVYYLCDLCLSL